MNRQQTRVLEHRAPSHQCLILSKCQNIFKTQFARFGPLNPFSPHLGLNVGFLVSCSSILHRYRPKPTDFRPVPAGFQLFEAGFQPFEAGFQPFEAGFQPFPTGFQRFGQIFIYFLLFLISFLLFPTIFCHFVIRACLGCLGCFGHPKAPWGPTDVTLG